jgi:hypothetical protein
MELLFLCQDCVNTTPGNYAFMSKGSLGEKIQHVESGTLVKKTIALV